MNEQWAWGRPGRSQGEGRMEKGRRGEVPPWHVLPYLTWPDLKSVKYSPATEHWGFAFLLIFYQTRWIISRSKSDIITNQQLLLLVWSRLIKLQDVSPKTLFVCFYSTITCCNKQTHPHHAILNRDDQNNHGFETKRATISIHLL